MEVAGNIQGKLADYIRDPQVAVIVADLKSHEYLTRVRVTGAVRQQSSIPYRQGMTVLDAVLQSGGVNEFAAPDKTKLYRKRNKETIVVPILLDALVNKGQLDWNYELQPGDVITVPERLF